MAVFRAFSFLFIALVLGLSVPSLSANTNSKASRHPASLSCSFLVRNTKAFEVGKFEAALDVLIAQGGPTDDDIRESIKHPEQFLAVIECLSMFQYGGQDGYGFKQLAKNLDKDELIKLNTIIVKATNTGRLTEHQLKMLLVDIYRLMHRPRSFWKAASNIKSIRRAFDKVDDQKIMERITNALDKDGILQNASIIVRDPMRVEKLGILLHENKKPLFASVQIAIWMGTILLVPQTASGSSDPWAEWIPKLLVPGILSLSYFIDNYFTDQDRQTIITKGLNRGIELVRQRMNRPPLTKRNVDLIRRTFLATVVTGIVLATVPDLITEIQNQRRQAVSKVLSESLREAQNFQQSVKKTPEELAAEEFKVVLDEMKASGAYVEPLKPMMEQLRKSLIEGYKRTLEP